MPTAQETPVTRRRSSRAIRNGDVKPSSATRRSRGVRQPTQSVLADVDRMISALIKENRELQHQIDKLSRQALGATTGTAERALRSIQRRISSVVDDRDQFKAAGLQTRGYRAGSGPCAGHRRRDVARAAAFIPRELLSLGPAMQVGRAAPAASP
jgi:hypothetical protein